MLAVGVVHERLIVGARSVDAVEIETRRPEVDERVRIVEAIERRHRVEGDVVIDELPEIGEASRDVRILVLGLPLVQREIHRLALVDPLLELTMEHRLTERHERRFAERRRQQLTKHPPEALVAHARVRNVLQPTDGRPVSTAHLAPPC